MSKSEMLHELYIQCKEINFDDSYGLMKAAKSEDEKEFVRTITDFILQQKQKEAIAEKRF